MSRVWVVLFHVNVIPQERSNKNDKPDEINSGFCLELYFSDAESRSESEAGNESNVPCAWVVYVDVILLCLKTDKNDKHGEINSGFCVELYRSEKVSRL